MLRNHNWQNAAASWKHGRWTLGGRFQLYSGLPYTPTTGSIQRSPSGPCSFFQKGARDFR